MLKSESYFQLHLNSNSDIVDLLLVMVSLFMVPSRSNYKIMSTNADFTNSSPVMKIRTY